jgi:integrase
MARRVKDKSIESREARLKLKVSGRPYWRSIGRGLHLGYRKGKTGGVWVIRRYQGDQTYSVQTIAQADDALDADGLEVLDFWQAQEAARNTRAAPAPKHGRYTVGDAITDYLASVEGKSSWRDASKGLTAFALPVFGDKPVDDLATDEIRNWHRTLASEPARRRTGKGEEQVYMRLDLDDPENLRKRQASANNRLGQLRAALNLAWRNGKARSDDVWRRVEPFKGVDIPRVRYLSIAQAQRLMNAAQGDFRVLVQAALQTGARYQELARLRVGDFNPDSGTLHIRQSKTGRDRHIVLTDEGQEFFAQLAAGRVGTELLLGREWSASSQDAPMREACKRAGIEPALNFHAMRHTWASLAVMSGLPLLVVAKNLGHSSTRMTERHYGHLSADYVSDAIRKHAPKFGLVPESNVKRIGR